MSDLTILINAAIVFALMLAGIILTVIEFKYGAPKRQEEKKSSHIKTLKSGEQQEPKIATDKKAA